MTTPGSPVETWSAILHPLAAKLNITFSSQLSEITLANIIAGETCQPIGLHEFEDYLTYREYSVENIQFIVWYQDYCMRYGRVDSQFEASIVTPHIPNRASLERRATDVAFPPPTAIPSTSKPQLPDCNHLSATSPEYRAFRKECMDVVATFVKSKSAKQLNLDGVVRDTLLRDLQHSVHPDVFLHVYREVYDTLSNSVPRFLAQATVSVNRQKQIYHYVVGVVLILISITIATILIACVHIPPNSNRAWRLFALPWWLIGCMSILSSYRGYCSQIAGRGNIQIRSWELQEHPSDEESYTLIRAAPSSLTSAIHLGPDTNDEDDCSITNSEKRAIAPFADEFSDGAPSDPLPVPKIFGPERVVIDPRVKALYSQLKFEMLVIGFLCTSVYSAIIFSVPGPLSGASSP